MEAIKFWPMSAFAPVYGNDLSPVYRWRLLIAGEVLQQDEIEWKWALHIGGYTDKSCISPEYDNWYENRERSDV